MAPSEIPEEAVFPPRSPLWSCACEHWPNESSEWIALLHRFNPIDRKVIEAIGLTDGGLSPDGPAFTWQYERSDVPGYGRRINIRHIWDRLIDYKFSEIFPEPKTEIWEPRHDYFVLRFYGGDIASGDRHALLSLGESARLVFLGEGIEKAGGTSTRRPRNFAERFCNSNRPVYDLRTTGTKLGNAALPEIGVWNRAAFAPGPLP
jgi:hypothetical protein